MSRILAIHLLNDRSGSPFVFRQSLEALQKEGHKIILFTSASEDGFLSDIPGVNYRFINYRWSKIKLITLFNFAKVNLHLLLVFLVKTNKNDIIYINSILPFGAAIAGRLKHSKVIYHMHEVSIKPEALKKWLITVVNHCASTCIHVSHFLKDALQLTVSDQQVIYNSLPQSFIQLAKNNNQTASTSHSFNILMICSLKDFKGIPEFIKLAAELPEMHFDLVLNASPAQIEDYFRDKQLSQNINTYPSQKDVHPFYQNTDVLVNLSRTDEWLETFGMTVLEGMYYGKPCIVPTKGGASELITHNQNGYHIAGKNTDELKKILTQLKNETTLYNSLSKKAFESALTFHPNHFKKAITDLFTLKSSH
ncbi:glycosyltransferase family 4 protein [Fulvivirga sediminis]|uniref:Glycosyltransferase family 4 protein n=1 Tax=Fulvivirga sediminis TaxID=2803949 RepID=A0A937K1L0_9BACT|nr:glycosyltransferase family 4 protein [Fulvivirga sediminis]MBL3656787.1 glycosyltransferase family 4 protein [Fulvivirga sediminis]